MAIEVSMTTFCDFVLKAGTPKYTEVVNCQKNQITGYDPKTDYYKAARERIIELESTDQPISYLSEFISTLTDYKKIASYPHVINGYRRWRGRKSISWKTPPKKRWVHEKLDILVNPELGLIINNEPHILKLYFKDEKLIKNRAEILTHLLYSTLSPFTDVGTTFCLLDVRRSKLFTCNTPNEKIETLLHGEASYWITIWNMIIAPKTKL